MIKVADLFCGGGGTSEGARQTGAVDVRFALNHWDVAIETHKANFPKTVHRNKKLINVGPSECEPIDLLFASPECTHHSRARGGRPTTDQQRAGAWEIMTWVEFHRPSFIVIENVVEFEEWGPVGKDGRPLKSLKGKCFQSWVTAIESLGYRVEWRRLNAADFGAATSRERLFVIARKGRRSINWPEPTHSKSSAPRLPGMETKLWRGANEIIDWSINLPSAFGRKRPLADKTLARIQKGLERHVAPFVVWLRNNSTGKPTEQPIGTMTAGGGHFGLSVPFVTTVNHGGNNGSRTKPIDLPLGVATSKNGRAIAVPMIAQFDNGSGQRIPRSAGSPIRTITTKNGQAIAVPLVMAPQSGGVAKTADTPVPPITTMAGSQLVVPFLTSFYGSQNTSDTTRPCPTITTVDRHALTGAMLYGSMPAAQTDAERRLQKVMAKMGVFDIGFRMLSVGELADAQGFPMDYKFCGTKKDVTKQIGNSVSPNVARAIVEALV